MTTIIGVDPGPVKSGLVRLADGQPPLGHVMENGEIRRQFRGHTTEVTLAIEVLTPRGQLASQEAFDTCIEAGRMIEAFGNDDRVIRVTYRECNLHLLGYSSGNDAQRWRILKDLYGGDKAIRGPQKCAACNGKGWRGRGRPTCEDCGGTGKGEPAGPLYSVSRAGEHAKDALAVAITASARVGAIYA